jgi:hypothetical protein
MKNKAPSFAFIIILGLIVGAYIYTSVSTSTPSGNTAKRNVESLFSYSFIQGHLLISWNGSSTTLCNSTTGISYAVIDYAGANQTRLDRGSCKGLLLSVEGRDVISALKFIRAHSSSFDAVIFDDYSVFDFGAVYANFSQILPVIPVEYFPSYDSYTMNYSSSLILPIGFGPYPNLTQSATSEEWNRTVVSYALTAKSLHDFSTNNGGRHYSYFHNIFVLVYEHSTSFQKEWSKNYIDGTIIASEKFAGLIVWGGSQFDA